MTTAKCLCGHVRLAHPAFDPGRCAVAGCGCKTFRTKVATPSLGGTCTNTHSVATGYGTLRCDLKHPHPGLHHHDPQHQIIWASCGDCGGST